jgi:hypothetical protein
LTFEHRGEEIFLIGAPIDGECGFLVIGGLKEREALDMIPVGMAQKQMEGELVFRIANLISNIQAKIPDAGTGIQNNASVLMEDGYTRGIAAVSFGSSARSGYRSSGSPEGDQRFGLINVWHGGFEPSIR